MTKITIEVDLTQYSLLKTIAIKDDSSIARICRREINKFISKNAHIDEAEKRYNEDGTEMD